MSDDADYFTVLAYYENSVKVYYTKKDDKNRYIVFLDIKEKK